MDTLETFRRRIDTATEMRSIVRTMKTLAAVRIRQYEQAVESLVEYNRALRLGFQILFADANQTPSDDAATRQRTPRCHGAIVFGSDQGLCGQFNEDISRYAATTMRQIAPPPREWTLLTIGTRVRSRLEQADWSVTESAQLPGSLDGIGPFVQKLLPQLEAWQATRRCDHLYLFFQKRSTAASCRPAHQRLLPPDLRALADQRAGEPGFRTLPTFHMDREALLRALIRQYLFVSLFRACAESLASENASRIAAMQAAEKNIEERLAELQAQLNQRRQTAITEEILDMVTGFEALTANRERRAVPQRQQDH